MVFRLVLDVVDDRIHLRLANGEHAVTALPCEFFVIWREGLNPSAAVAFHLFHHMGDGFCAGKHHQSVDVVLDATYAQRLTAGRVDQSADVLVQPFEMFRCHRGTGVLGVEHDVQIYLTERLCHILDAYAPSGRLYIFHSLPTRVLSLPTALPLPMVLSLPTMLPLPMAFPLPKALPLGYRMVAPSGRTIR